MRPSCGHKSLTCAHPPLSVSLHVEDSLSVPLEPSCKGLALKQSTHLFAVLNFFFFFTFFFFINMPGALASRGWDAFKVLQIGNPHVKDTEGNDKRTCPCITKLGRRCKNTRDTASRAQAKLILNRMSLRDPSDFASRDVVAQELKDLADEVLCRNVHLHGRKVDRTGENPPVPMTEVVIDEWRVLINNYIREQAQLRRSSTASSRDGSLEDDDNDSGDDSDDSDDSDSDGDGDDGSEVSVILPSIERLRLSHRSSRTVSTRSSFKRSVTIKDEDEDEDEDPDGIDRERSVTLVHSSPRRSRQSSAASQSPSMNKVLKALEKLTIRVKTLEEEKARAEKEKTALRRENTRLVKENQRQKRQIFAMEEKQDDLEDQIDELFGEVNDYMETVQRIKDETSGLSRRCRCRTSE